MKTWGGASSRGMLSSDKQSFTELNVHDAAEIGPLDPLSVGLGPKCFNAVRSIVAHVAMTGRRSESESESVSVSSVLARAEFNGKMPHGPMLRASHAHQGVVAWMRELGFWLRP